MSKATEVWIVEYESEDRSTQIENRDGVGWHDAPIPSRWHRCSPQTRGWTGYFNRVYRCACGAISDDGRYWMERNARRVGR